MNYRAEIDGLRALAVVPVIFFHAGFDLFKGGYVGVDIFFVISGYLITSLLMNDLKNQKFSIINFYERRARRLLPALFLVLVVSIPPALFLLVPIDLKNFGQSLVAVSYFASNFLFWLEFDYFDTASELKPLIHTWSLAIEEQFYILFPILLLVIFRLGSSAVLAIFFIIFSISLLLAEWASSNMPTANFYLLPFRGWELLIGAMLSLVIQEYGFIRSLKINQLLSIAGFVIIVISILAFDHKTPFPGFTGLMPTIGTAILILSAVPGTLAYKFLTLKSIVLIGLISYSAYLWHQPLLVYSRYFFTENLNYSYLVTLCILPFIFAYFTWKHVEKPFRDRQKIARKTIFTFSFLGIIFFSMVGLFLHFSDGLKNRLPENLREENLFKSSSVCNFNNLGEKLFQSIEVKECLENSNKSIFLIGDSHANALAYSLENEFKSIGITLINISSSGCFPIFGTINTNEMQRSNCDAMKRFLEDEVINLNRPIILSSRWRLNIEGDRYNNGEGGIEWGKPKQTLLKENHSKDNLYLHIEKEMIKLSKKSRLFLINQIPEIGTDPIRKKFLNPSKVFDHDYHEYLTQNHRINNLFNNIPNITLIKSDELVCDHEDMRCKTSLNNGEELYIDSHHPSINFSKLIAIEVKKEYEKSSL